MLNKKFLKTLLTTASTVAFISGAATSASASDFTMNDNAGVRTNGDHIIGGDLDEVTYGFEAETTNWSTGYNVIFSGADNRTLTTGEWGDVGINQIVVKGGTPSLNIIGNTTTINKIDFTDGVTSGDKLSVTLQNGTAFVVNGSDLPSLGTINAANPGNGTVTISATVTKGHVGAIGGTGKIATFTTSGADSSYDNNISATTLNVNGTSTFGGALNATTLTVGAASTFGGAVTATSTTVNAASTFGGAVKAITELKVNADSTFSDEVYTSILTVADKITATANGKLKIYDSTITGTLTGSGAIYLVDAIGGGELTVDGALTGNKTITTEMNNEGTLTLNAAVSDGDIGQIGVSDTALAAVNVNYEGDNTFASGIYSQNLNFAAGANGALNGQIVVETLNIDSGDVTTAEDLSVATKLQFAANGSLTVVGGDSAPYIEAIDSDVDYEGTVTFNSQVNTFVSKSSGVGKIGETCKLKALNVNYVGNNTFSEAIKTQNFTLGAGANVTTKSAVTLSNNGEDSGLLSINTGTFTADAALTLTGSYINFNDDGQLVVNSTIAGGGHIRTSDSGTGKVTFNHTIEVGDVGEIGHYGEGDLSLKEVIINPIGNANFNKAITANKVTIGQDKMTNSTVNSTMRTNNLVIGGDGTLVVNTLEVTGEGMISFIEGSTGPNGGSLTVTTAGVIDFISTYEDGKGQVTFTPSISPWSTEDTLRVGQIGQDGNAIHKLNLNAGGTIGDNVYAKTINSSAGDLTIDTNVTVVGDIAIKTSNNLTLNNGASLTGNVSTIDETDIAVYFGENTKFVGNIGTADIKANYVEVDGDVANYTSMEGNVYTNAFLHHGGLQLTGDLTISSAITADDESKITLSGNTLTAGGLILGDDVTTTIVTGSGGSVVLESAKVGAGGFSTTADHVAKIVFNFSDAAIPAHGEALTPMVINSTGEGVDDVKAYLEANASSTNIADNHYLTLSAVPVILNDSGKLSVTFASSPIAVSEITKNEFSKLNSGNAGLDTAFIKFITASANNTLGLSERKAIAILGANSNTIEDVAEAVKGFNKTDTNAFVSAASSVTASSVDAVTSAINTRVLAVSSGDEDRAMGVWVSATGGMGKQGTRKGEAGFKSNNFGLTVGADTEINDKAIIGLAGTFSNASVKMKNALAGDKVKAKTYALSLYGNYNIDNCWNVQGALSVARTKSTVSTAISKAKFNSTNIGAKAMVGYTYELKEVMFTPMVGLEYANLGKSKATEATTIAGVSKVTKIKAMNKVAGILGIKASKEIQGFTPEVHAFVNYDLKARTPKSTIHLGADGTVDFATPHAKLERASYNVGTSVSYMYDDMEYAIGYDATIANKYLAHQGSIKLRLNF